MESDFQQLAHKIQQLADLTQSLRQENAHYKLHIKSLTEEKDALTSKIEEASVRINRLLDQLPSDIVEEEKNEETA